MFAFDFTGSTATAGRLGSPLVNAQVAHARAEPDDLALVEAFRRGDRSAFEALVRRHQRPVWAIVRRFTPDRDAADDLAQRAFIVALERIAELRGAFRPWLLRIAVNLSKNHVRDNARLVHDPGNGEGVSLLDVPFHSKPDEAMDRERLWKKIAGAVTSLPARQRDVVMLRVDGQLSFAEVGESLDITENNAKVTYHHAVKRLRELLEGIDAGL